MKAVFSIWDKKVFCKNCKAFVSAAVATAIALLIFCFCFICNGPYIEFIYLENDEQPQLQTSVYGAYQTIQCFLVKHFSLLPGSTSNITSCTLYGSRVVIQGLRYCTNTKMKNMQELWVITFYWDAQLTGDVAPKEMISLTQHFKQILELTTIETEGGYKIIVIVQYILQWILCGYDLIMHIYICSHFSWPCTVCVCVPKLNFW